VARAFGRRWYGDGRSAVLFVPSAVARMERNLVINALHPDFGRIRPGLEVPVWWDARLFG
jgi:RES domain-containing protein